MNEHTSPFIKEIAQRKIDLANKAEKIAYRIRHRQVLTERDKKLQAEDLRRLKRLQDEIDRPVIKK